MPKCLIARPLKCRSCYDLLLSIGLSIRIGGLYARKLVHRSIRHSRLLFYDLYTNNVTKHAVCPFLYYILHPWLMPVPGVLEYLTWEIFCVNTTSYPCPARQSCQEKISKNVSFIIYIDDTKPCCDFTQAFQLHIFDNFLFSKCSAFLLYLQKRDTLRSDHACLTVLHRFPGGVRDSRHIN